MGSPSHADEGVMFEASLPVPPTANNLFPTSKSGHRFTSSEYRAWKELAAAEFKGCFQQLNGRLQAEYHYVFKDFKRRDLANFEKAVTDFLVTKGVFEDDCQIDVLILRRLPKGKESRVYIKIHEIGAGA